MEKNPEEYENLIDKNELVKNLEGTINLPEYYIFNDKSSFFYNPYPDKELQFDGEVYLLIGSETLHFASWFASIVKDNGYGEVIGEPSGSGSVLSEGCPIYIPLPATKWMVFLPRIISVRTLEKARKDEPDAVYPDVYISTTFEDYFNEIDPCWEYLVENVFKKEIK